MGNPHPSFTLYEEVKKSMDKLVEINGYEGYFVNKKGKLFSNKRGKLKELTYSKDKDGYIRRCLVKNGISKHYRLHRLIAETFISNPNNYKYVNHKNGIKDDNRVENLEWCTAKINTNHSIYDIKVSHTQPLEVEIIKSGKILNFDNCMDFAKYLGLSYKHTNAVLNGEYKGSPINSKYSVKKVQRL